jgi:hypothetical protein
LIEFEITLFSIFKIDKKDEKIHKGLVNQS